MLAAQPIRLVLLVYVASHVWIPGPLWSLCIRVVYSIWAILQDGSFICIISLPGSMVVNMIYRTRSSMTGIIRFRYY